jgi:hypothetical protein
MIIGTSLFLFGPIVAYYYVNGTADNVGQPDWDVPADEIAERERTEAELRKTRHWLLNCLDVRKPGSFVHATGRLKAWLCKVSLGCHGEKYDGGKLDKPTRQFFTQELRDQYTNSPDTLRSITVVSDTDGTEKTQTIDYATYMRLVYFFHQSILGTVYYCAT